MALSVNTMALSVNTMALSVDTMVLSVNTMALSVDTIALSVDTIALSVDTNAIAKGEEQGTLRALEKPDITQSPVPRFDLLKRYDYLMMAIQFSRGCP
ncbi:MAG: hypothetical protein V7K90_17515 [Nostoc sp.]|uniref:hypothetical protein n=1 Tax=Nostoc sp. TaxID=1180 RepID=UPI002FF9B42F